MHSSTKSNLKMIADWTNDVAIADSFATALQAGIPKRSDEGSYVDLTNSFGDLTLTLYEAASVGEIKPFLVHARKCGFKREGKVHGNVDGGSLTWNYLAPIDGETKKQKMTLKLLFKQGTEEEPASCGYVQIGVKEVPEMKLMCGDEYTAWTKLQEPDDDTSTLGDE